MSDTTKRELPDSKPITRTGDRDIPESERGKAENMPLDRRAPSVVFGIVGLTYWLVLIAVLAVGGLWWWLSSR